MVRCGMRTIKGAYDNPIMLSMLYKGALHVVPGLASYSKFPHQMPADLFEMVQQEGSSRFPVDFRDSIRFEDEVREMVRRATDWRI